MRLIRTFNWCNQYGIDKVEVVLSDNVATIINSNKIKKKLHKSKKSELKDFWKK